MSDLRKSTGLMRQAMKAVVRRSLTMVGGGENFQHVTRVKSPALSRYASPTEDNEENHCPIDVAMDLDLETGEDAILATWADQRGYDLVKREPSASSDMPWCSRMGVVAEMAGDILKAIGDALKDGVISKAEGLCIIGVIDTAIDMLRKMRERVAAESGAGR